MTGKRILTVPNLLSFFRLLLVPAFIVSYMQLGSADTVAIWPIVILALSGITDLFDGMIARKFNQVSDLGKMLDPLADKLTQISVLVCLTIRHVESWAIWVLLVLFLIRECSILIGGLVMLKGKRREVPQAKWFGKLSTFEFYTAMLLLLVFPNMPAWSLSGLALLTAALAAFSLIMYVIHFFRKPNV